jgi:hypothetical protein
MQGGKTGTIIDKPISDSSRTKKKKSKIVTAITPIINESVEATTVMNMMEPTSQYIRNTSVTDISKLNGEGAELDSSVIALIGGSSHEQK